MVSVSSFAKAFGMFVCRIPSIGVRLCIPNILSGESPVCNALFPPPRAFFYCLSESPSSPPPPLKPKHKTCLNIRIYQMVQHGGDCEATVDIVVAQPLSGNIRGNLWSPRFPKAEEVGWWVVLGTEAGELLALKRVSHH